MWPFLEQDEMLAEKTAGMIKSQERRERGHFPAVETITQMSELN